MKLVAYIWGVGGVLLLLSFAIFRLAPLAFELASVELSLLHWCALFFSVVYMAYAEGYKGFHLAFAPRVISRAQYLHANPKWNHILFAPLFCMGYIHATRKRQILSISLTALIVCFVLVARQLPQPWRGIVDAGVVVGLSLGILSILYFMYLAVSKPDSFMVPTEVPVST